MGNENQYICYDYKEATVSKKLELIWRDSFHSLGWNVEKSAPAIVKPVWAPLRIMAAPLALLPGNLFKDMVQAHESDQKVQLNLKRKRQIQNKNELNRLQSSMESVLNEMEHMEATKTLSASVGAYLTGLVGTVCMALSVFCYLGGNLTASVGFAVPGFGGWILAFAVYSLIKKRKEKVVGQVLEQKIDAVNDICRQAYELIFNE